MVGFAIGLVTGVALSAIAVGVSVIILRVMP